MQELFDVDALTRRIIRLLHLEGRLVSSGRVRPTSDEDEARLSHQRMRELRFPAFWFARGASSVRASGALLLSRSTSWLTSSPSWNARAASNDSMETSLTPVWE